MTTKQLCPKCRSKVRELYQWAGEWICRECFPANEAKILYPNWKRTQKEKE